MTATPRGYHLYGPKSRRDTYNWHSDTGLMRITKTIRGKTYLVTQAQEKLWENVIGGNSIRWKLLIFADWDGGDPIYFKYSYLCGINVPDATDHLCTDHSGDASGYFEEYPMHDSIGAFSSWETFAFGSKETNYKKFPMVRYTIGARDSGHMVYTHLYHRGHDIQHGSTWYMSTTTGTGG